MNSILEINNTELESIEECKYCSQSSILMSSFNYTSSTLSTSSNFKDKEYFLLSDGQ